MGEPLARDETLAHYKVLRCIGAGGMGRVYLARDTVLGRRVALKVLADGALGADAIERVLAEARATAMFSHPNIVSVYEVGASDGTPYIALEYVEGEPLDRRLANERLPFKEALRVARAIADALATAHAAGILHRDLKPSNVVMASDGRVRVVDFGLARAVGAVGDGEMAGTPEYMAPEQWRGEAVAASDVWALAVLAHEMLTGARPYAAAAYSEVWPILSGARRIVVPSTVDLPAGARALLDDCFDPDPSKRPTAAAVAARLEALLVPAALEDVSPFRALAPFDVGHADLYFGRDTDVAACVERLRDRARLAVVGASGAGKTSFVRAGVVPRLRERGAWELVALRPGADPFASIAAALADAEGAASRDALAEELARAPERVALHLAELARARSAKVLLFVDALEETLAAPKETRDAFGRLLAHAAEDPSEPVRAIFTVRDDFLARCAESPELGAALREVLILGTPPPARLEDAVRLPVARVGYAFDDPEMVGDMVRPLEHERAALPLLQFACSRLWERRDRARRLLRRADLEAVGGVTGALAEHARTTLMALTPAEIATARAVLLRLITPDRTRRARAMDELCAIDDARTVVDRLVRARLLTVHRDGAHVTVEIAHESLLHEWTELRRWIDETEDASGALRDLEEVAAIWDKRGRPADGLWRGAALEQAARALGAQRARASAQAAAFVEEALRRDARRRVLARATIAVLAATAIGASVASFGFFRQKTRADRESAVAVERFADGEREAAEAALGRGDLLRARAMLRGSLEAHDSLEARALFTRVRDDPRLFSVEIPTTGTGLSASPDGARFAVGGNDGVLRLFDVATARMTRVGALPGGWIRGVAFSPDGRTIAASCTDGTIHLFAADGSGGDRVLRGHASAVNPIAWSADGKVLASIGDDVRVWDVARGETARVLATGGSWQSPLALRADGKRLAAVLDGTTITVWNTETGDVVRTLEGHRDRVQWLAWGARGQLASASATEPLHLWNADDGALLRTLEGRAMLFSPSGERLATSDEGIIHVWDVESGALAGAIEGTFDRAAFVDEHRIATTGRDRQVKLYDLHARAPIVAAHAEWIHRVAFRADGKRIASCASDGTTRIWDAESGAALRVIASRGDPWGLAFEPDGSRLAIAARGDALKVYDSDSGRLLRALSGEGVPASAVDWSRDGATLATGGEDGAVGIFDARTGAHVAAAGPTQLLFDVKLSPDGARVAAAGDDGVVRVYDTRTTRMLAALPAHASVVRGLDFSPEGDRLASSSQDGTFRVWSFATNDARSVAAHGGRTYAARFAPDGRFLFSAGADATIRRWSAADLSPIDALRGHRDEIDDLAVSRDGALVATGADDATVRLWDARTGRPLWRGVGLDRATGDVLTHRGWSGGAPARAGWRSAAAARAERFDARGDYACIAWDRHVEGWPVDAASPSFQVPLASEASAVVATRGACWVDESGHLARVDSAGARDLGEGRLASCGDRVAVLRETGLELLDQGGTVVERAATAEPIVALACADGERVAATRGGRVATVRDDGRLDAAFDVPTAARATAIALGPAGTAAVGFANGGAVVFARGSGRALLETRLHGAIVDLAVVGTALVVLSELGDTRTVPLDALTAGRCDLLREVRARIPVVWTETGAVVQPGGDDCR